MITPDRTELSPNVNIPDMPASVRTVIIHCTRSGAPGNPSELEGTLHYMKTPGTVSSHWVIGRNGEQVRVVPDFRQAWHAQEDNDNAWGIEVCQGVEADGFTPAQIDALVEVCRGYVEDFGVDARHGTTSTSGGFVGHQETAQGRRNGKSDPGHLFPWDQFIQRLQEPPAPPVGNEVVGIGTHYTDGSTSEIWAKGDNDNRVLDGLGVRYENGTIQTVWERTP